MIVEYHPNNPACLLHGYGHWTKNCKELAPQNKDKE